MATSASISASARLSDQRETDVRPASARSEDLPDTLCRLAAVNGETIGVGGVLHLDIVLEAAARHALILTGPDEFNAAAMAALLVGPGLHRANRCLLGQVELRGGSLHELPIFRGQIQTASGDVVQLAERRKPCRQAQAGYSHGCEKNLPHARFSHAHFSRQYALACSSFVVPQ